MWWFLVALFRIYELVINCFVVEICEIFFFPFTVVLRVNRFFFVFKKQMFIFAFVSSNKYLFIRRDLHIWNHMLSKTYMYEDTIKVDE